MAGNQKPKQTKRGGRRPGAGRPPGARTKISKPLREAAAEYSPDALQKLVSLLNSESEDIQLRASKEILDRAHGRPSQAVDISGQINLSLASRLEAARRRVGKDTE